MPSLGRWGELSPLPRCPRTQAVSELGGAAPQPVSSFRQVGFHTDPGQAAAVSICPCHPVAGGC